MSEKAVTKKKSSVKRVAVSEENQLAVGGAFSVHQNSANEVLKKCETITQVGSDEQNDTAREIAKSAKDLKSTINKARLTFNKPLNDRIKQNNEDAKKLTEPLENQIERIKGLIGEYEQEKERIRQEELRKAEEERLRKEEEERLRQRAIQAIRDKINDIQSEWNKKIHECRTVKTLDKYEKEIKALKITKNEFGEQVESMKQVKTILLEQIADRYDVVKQLEKADADEKERLLAEEQKELAEKQQTLSLEEQSMETMAEQDLLVLLSSLWNKDIGWLVDDKLEELKQKYGSAREAILYREQIIKDEQQHLENNQSIKDLKGDKVKNQRKEVKFRIVDEQKIPREYMKVDEASIKAAMGVHRAELKNDINAFSIDGVEFYIESTTVLK